MPPVTVDSLNDPRLQAYRNLKFSKLTRWSGLFVVEGQKLVEQLLASDYAIESVLVCKSFVPQFSSRMPIEVPVLLASDQLVKELVGYNFHRGILACGRRKPNPDLSELLRIPAPHLTLVICPDVEDPTNLGSILRVSSAFGVDAVLLGQRCADPFSRRVLRVSMGAVFRLPIVQTDDLPGDLQRLRSEWDVELAATVLDSQAQPLDTVKRPDRFGLLFGSEGRGLDRQWVESCHRQITIPMKLGTDSLNVAVVAGIILYHLTKDHNEVMAGG